MNKEHDKEKKKPVTMYLKKRFRNLTKLHNNYFEIEFAKSRISLDLSIQIGYFILQYAKLCMLEFYYDYLDKYCNREDIELMSMDTDSLYMAISEEVLTNIIIPDMRNNFKQEERHWFPRINPPEAAAFDRREPGLFKEKIVGTSMVALCSKTYCLKTKAEIKN